MIQVSPEVQEVLAAYPTSCRPMAVTPLGDAGGYSGAALWRVETAAGPLGLKRWPEGFADLQRLALVHAVLRHVWHCGMRLVPVPMATAGGASFIEAFGHVWELATWLPGRADYHESPSSAKLQAAFAALAQFHLAAASFPLPHMAGDAIAPAVTRRLQRIRQLHEYGVGRIEQAALSGSTSPLLAARAAAIVAAFRRRREALQAQLHACREPVRQQPCIRDIHDRHVLFDNGQICGLVDFGSLNIDHVATDVARLLGTMAGDDAELRQIALTAYEGLRPLSVYERRLVATLDRANVVLSGMQWLEWLLVERRLLAKLDTILPRIDSILLRLGRLEISEAS